MGPSLATKENRKGSARKYNSRRKLGTSIVALAAAASLFIWRRSHGARTGLSQLGGGGERVGTVVGRAIRAIEYGVQSTPVVMIRASLDEELHNRFLQEHLFSCSEAELDDVPGLDHRVNVPVYVHEGYYHGLRVGEDVYSKNPNPLIGKDFMKPAASPFTRAFFEAVRRVNGEIFDKLKQDLLQASSFNSTKREDVCYLLAKWIDEGHHFGDLSIQIHYGKGNDEKLKSGAAWHTDAENSLLHMAVTLRGERVLHSKRNPQHAVNGTLRRHNNDRGEPMMEILDKQKPGDVYLSSSTLMRHAPQFFDTDYDTRAIAIHARILYTSADVDDFRRKRTKDSWESLTTVLANNLAAASFQIPSLSQVESSLSLMT